MRTALLIISLLILPATAFAVDNASSADTVRPTKGASISADTVRPTKGASTSATTPTRPTK